MKIIKNTSMQGLNIPFATPEGVKSIFLAPKQQAEISDNWKSRIVENLVHRRMVKLTHTPDPVQQPVSPSIASKATIKRTRKSS